MAINDTVPEIFGSDAPTGSDGLFGYMLRQALVTIFYLTQDEFVLLLACALPFWYGVIAALQTVNGALQSRPRAHVLSFALVRHRQPQSHI